MGQGGFSSKAQALNSHLKEMNLYASMHDPWTDNKEG